MRSGSLYIVATPIGNLEDITLRALRVLKEVSLIAAEDTRHTKKLMSHYGIDTRLTSYHEHNEREKAPEIIERLRAGADVALVSDAGTPGISDPGYRLVRLAVENSLPVVPVPGPSALLSVLSVSGMPMDEFTFKGFPPPGGAQLKKFLLELKRPEHTFVMYESPRRITETLGALIGVLGDIEVLVGREMTKVHEEILRGRASEVKKTLEEKGGIKGEITLVVRTESLIEGATDFRAELEGLLKSGFRLKDAVKAVADEFGLNKSEVYKEALKIKEGLE